MQVSPVRGVCIGARFGVGLRGRPSLDAASRGGGGTSSTGPDISARVVAVGRLLVVVHVNVRERPQHRGEGRARRMANLG